MSWNAQGEYVGHTAIDDEGEAWHCADLAAIDAAIAQGAKINAAVEATGHLPGHADHLGPEDDEGAV